jgi:indolepyruvate ferredoxin oxidoreductase beta subunit
VKALNFLIVGVGGQGTLLASNVLADVGVEAGFDVKKAEVHGMSQRGGSVNSHVRWGENVHSPVIADGEADVLVSLEKLETLRYLHMVRPAGKVFIGEFKIPPLTVSSGEDHYPEDDEISQAVCIRTDQVFWIRTLKLAEKAGTTRAHNVVMLGALSVFIPQVPENIWLKVIAERVPAKYIDINHHAFQLGRETQEILTKQK